jgi:hypothetical protein
MMRCSWKLRIAVFVLAGAAFMPAPAPAATLRMVIQSHPDVGARCIDVPNAQLVPGMRIQMWDCNNTVAQTFSYDDTNLQLTIGNLCMESWGRGDPQDTVGLGSCNGQANQHWKIVASGNYYQIVGVNGLCLDIRYGVKENGTPLDIYTCAAAPVVQRLWALVEAPAGDSLGHVWDETDPGGWKAVWTRRGDTNVFDAVWANSDGRKTTTVNSVTVDGNNITINRTASSDGIVCTYIGILVGAKVSGTFACAGDGAGQWQVTIR